MISLDSGHLQGRADSGERGGTSVCALTVDITPSRSTPLFGFQGRTDESNSVRSRLEANVLGLCSSDAPPIYIVTTDTLYGGSITAGLLHRLSLKPSQVIVCGSHSHFAPGVDPELPKLGPTREAYVACIVERIAVAVEGAVWHPAARVGWGSGETQGLFMNRRRPTFGVGLPVPGLGRNVTGPHKRGRVDPVARAASISVGSRVVAILWGVSCHPVCSPDPAAVSAGFPGDIRNALRKDHGHEVPVLFFQGFSGDVRPNSQNRRIPRGFRKQARYVIAGFVQFTEQSERDYSKWCQELGRVVRGALARSLGVSEPVERLCSRFGYERPDGWVRSAQIHYIRISNNVSLVGLNAEVMNERIDSVQSTLGGFVIPAGCCNEVIGYWPTDEMRRRRGYEAETAEKFFPVLDWATAGGPDNLWAKMLRLLTPGGVESQAASEISSSLPSAE